jgi:hypothetical protein
MQMIERLDLDEATRLSAAIKNDQSPGAQAAARAKRDQWLREHEMGRLAMTADVKAALQAIG